MGIDGAVNGVKAIWDATWSTENWGVLSVDKKTRSKISTVLECCRQFYIYGRTELVLFLFVIVTSERLPRRTGMERSFSCTVGKT